MENPNITKKPELSIISTDTTVTNEVSEEFTLPDYIPEVRKLLYVGAQYLPENKYISDSKVEFSGTVTYLVIYTDDEGSLCSTPLSTSLEGEGGLNGANELVFIDTIVDGVSTRVNAPRRLTIKSRLKSRILGIENREIEENISPKSSADELYLQRDIVSAPTFKIYQASMQGIKASDNLDMQGVKNATPLWCDAYLVINDCKSQNRSVSVRGEIMVKCICQVDNEYVTLTRLLPLAEEIECEKAKTGDFARAYGRVRSLSISNEINDESNQLFFDVECEVDCEVARKEEAYLTRDCYSTECESHSSYKDIDVYSL
jgi:hypothetical protein